jgi:hypothetical protein
MKGVAIKFIEHYKPDPAVTIIDRVLVSCQSLGHTFVMNVGEPSCQVCGAPNPDIGAVGSPRDAKEIK